MTDDASELSHRQPKTLESLIHQSAWKGNSANFGFTEF
jgi:hypothetical protein